jgi:hypothetical protein
MRFYTQQHEYYCGVDLHARSMFVHILDQHGQCLFAKDLPACPDAFRAAVAPYRAGLVVGCECMFAWYWLADLCEDEAIPFTLGHALYMKAIHGGKSKNDRIDAAKIAGLLRGGMFPMALVYARAMRATRDLLRRRTLFVRQKAQLIAHIQNTNSQYNLPPFERKLSRHPDYSALTELFSHASTRLSIAADATLIQHYQQTIAELETHFVNFVVFTGVAFVFRLPVAHSAALVCLTVGYLTGYHLVASDLAGTAQEDWAARLAELSSSGPSGSALLVLFAVTVAVAEGLVAKGRAADAFLHRVGACVVALISLVIAGRWGTGEPARATIIFGVAAVSGLILSRR